MKQTQETKDSGKSRRITQKSHLKKTDKTKKSRIMTTSCISFTIPFKDFTTYSTFITAGITSNVMMMNSFSRQRHLFSRCSYPIHRFVSGKFPQNSRHALHKILNISKWLVMLGEFPSSLQRRTCCPLLFSRSWVNKSAGVGVLTCQCSSFSQTGF